MYQFSTYDSVFNGQYEGGIKIDQLQKKGNFGLGTFDSLEGELVAFDGLFFHCTNGSCTPAASEQSLAWAAICDFSTHASWPCPNLVLSPAGDLVSSSHIFSQALVAIKIHAFFDFVQITSTPKQKKPYPSIQEVINNSIEKRKELIEGTCVGWFAPDFMGGVKKPGFHFHFIDSTHRFGGHVLEFKIRSGEISIFEPSSFTVDFFLRTLKV